MKHMLQTKDFDFENEKNKHEVITAKPIGKNL